MGVGGFLGVFKKKGGCGIVWKKGKHSPTKKKRQTWKQPRGKNCVWGGFLGERRNCFKKMVL